jgi:nucleoside-diphosphate-sugar epimerase
MRIAIAGAGGFIGGRCAAALRDGGRQVVGFGREGMTAGMVDGVVWAAGGRGEPDALEEMHVRAPLEALDRVSRGGRFVYLSSGEVYGPAAVPFREEQAADPRTPYARAKLLGERALAERAERLAIRLVALRPGVVYGPGQRGSMLIPALIAALRAGARFPMTAGGQTRDYVFVDDLAALVAKVIDDEGARGTYNAGSGKETPVADVALGLARLIGGTEGVGLIGLGEVPYRDGEQMRYALDGSRARRELGWEARVGLDEGLARALG